MGTPNWGKLLRQDRVKAVGVPWSEEELHALYELNIPAAYVRDGILTTEDYEKALKSEEKSGVPISRQPRQEVARQARELDIDFTPDTPDNVLRELVSKGESPLKNASKDDLKEMLEEKGLPVSGNKKELIERLREN